MGEKKNTNHFNFNFLNLKSKDDCPYQAKNKSRIAIHYVFSTYVLEIYLQTGGNQLLYKSQVLLMTKDKDNHNNDNNGGMEMAAMTMTTMS